MEKLDIKSAIGVIICKLQTPDIHDGHHGLIKHVLAKHSTVVMFLGVARNQFSFENPLDFQIRKEMVQQVYQNIIILPMDDNRSDEKWSINIDNSLRSIFPERTCVLYGSRDSFIPRYHGKHYTEEFPEIGTHNATDLRAEARIKPINCVAFRKGVIFGIGKQRPVTYPTVDVVVLSSNGNILLARKPSETLFRFVGGFVDREDDSYEMAARRELYEETNLTSLELTYVTSQAIDDWRYKGQKNGIMTSLFMTHYWDQMGTPKASDDIAEVKWYDPKDFFKLTIGKNLGDGHVPPKHFEWFLEDKIVPEHIELMKTFIKYLIKNNLINK